MVKNRSSLVSHREKDTSCLLFIPKFFLIKMILCVLFLINSLTAYADIVSDHYLAEYFKNICNNPELEITFSADGISSRNRVLAVIDFLNNNTTTYASSDAPDAVAATTYLDEAVALLAENTICCINGTFDPTTHQCNNGNSGGGNEGDDDIVPEQGDCGAWTSETTVSCLAEGQYLHNGTCQTCPSGWLCPAGTNGALAQSYYDN